MIGFIRPVPLLFLGLILAANSASAQNKALPVTAPTAPAAPAPPAVPARVDVVTFDYYTDGEHHHLVVTPTPARLRVDETDDGFSIIYNPATEFYLGLENRNYTYWEFSWPEVRTAVQSSQRYETRLKDLGVEGFNGDSSSSPSPTDSTATPPADTNSAPSSDTSVGSDDTGYAWEPATKHKRVAGYDCVLWVGKSLSNGNVDAWCYAGPLPKVQGALEAVRTINEPVALVPVRTLVPPFVYEIYGSLVRGGVTPLEIDWGGQQDSNRFELVSVQSREGKANLFSIPKLYRKTTLVTMDGMITPAPAPAPNPQVPVVPEFKR